MEETFIHAFDDDRVMAGNGTIGFEILEHLPVDVSQEEDTEAIRGRQKGDYLPDKDSSLMRRVT
ncbi:MAG: hypothetical protein WD929_10755 [Steroidobacteraceae bacterium]